MGKFLFWLGLAAVIVMVILSIAGDPSGQHNGVNAFG